MTRNFPPASDVDRMMEITDQALHTCNVLIGALADDLHEWHHRRIAEVLEDSSRVGMELCVDGKGKRSVCQVAIELEDYRRSLFNAFADVESVDLALMFIRSCVSSATNLPYMFHHSMAIASQIKLPDLL